MSLLNIPWRPKSLANWVVSDIGWIACITGNSLSNGWIIDILTRSILYVAVSDDGFDQTKDARWFSTNSNAAVVGEFRVPN
jgi:hypothetical protein